MADDLFDLAAAFAADVALDKAAKRHRWVRLLRALGALLIWGLVIAAVCVTFWYS